MNVVADTNVVISGLLWRGAERAVLDAARSGSIKLFTSPALLAEIEDVLKREKFVERLAAANITAHELVLGYASLATVIAPEPIDPAVHDDPDDDAVLSCAMAAQCEVIVSGDRHLLKLAQYKTSRIMTAVQLLKEL